MEISVIIPFHNEQRHIEACIKSLLAQNFPRNDYEIIMIDNNSTDESVEVVKQYNDIKLLTEKKIGAYAARNSGIVESKGKIVAFTDADCAVEPVWLRNISDAMQRPAVSILQGRVQFKAAVPLLSMLENYEAEKADFIFSHNEKELYYGYTNNMAVRKEMFEKMGLFQELKRGADVLFVHRIINGYSCEAVQYSPDVRVVHLEIKSLRNYYLKNYIYGKSIRNYSKIMPTRPLNTKERFKVYYNTIKRRNYPLMKSALLLILLCLGGFLYEFGRLRQPRVNQKDAELDCRKSDLGKKKIRDSIHPLLILLSSNFLGLAVGGLFFLSASWSFELVEMGKYAVAISIQLIVVGFIGTGLGVAVVRLATDHLTENEPSEAAGVVIIAYLTSAVICLLVAGIFFGLAQLTFEQPLLAGGLLGWIILWAGARSMIDCLRSGLLAQQQYSRAGMLMVVSAVTGLVSLGIVISKGQLTVERLLVAHVFGLGTGAIAGLGLLLPLWNRDIHLSARLLRELIVYARWPALSEGIRLLQINLGPFVLLAVAGSAQAGLFSIGRYPAFLFGVVAISLYQYWLPKVAREKGTEQLRSFLKRQMFVAGLAGGAMFMGAIAFLPFLPLLGSNFAIAAPLFLLNTLDFIIFILVRPIETVYHGMYKPQLELILRISRLPVLLGLAFLLSYRYGAVGMVWAHVLSGIVAMGLAVWLLYRNIGSHPYRVNI